MIDLSTFEIQEYKVTNNWSDLRLWAMDKVYNKRVLVCYHSYSNTSDEWLISKRRAVYNIEHIRDYLIRNKIDDLSKWLEQPYNVRFTFATCQFNYFCPCFVNDDSTHRKLYEKR